MSHSVPERRPWPTDFPDVVIHTSVPVRDSHEAYSSAKTGDPNAALLLAEDLLDMSNGLNALRQMIGNRPTLLLPVVADETGGFNAIPDAMAHMLEHFLGIEAVSGEIVQTNMVGHTRAKSFQRLVTPATFDGPVKKGVDYILVDDHVGLGGTLANLRGYVEANGAHVVGIATLAESRDGRKISLRPETLDMLRTKHGEELDKF